MIYLINPISAYVCFQFMNASGDTTYRCMTMQRTHFCLEAISYSLVHTIDQWRQSLGAYI